MIGTTCRYSSAKNYFDDLNVKYPKRVVVTAKTVHTQARIITVASA